MVKERHQVAAMTFKAWDFVCQTRDCKGLQMAPYLSREMATRLKVETLTEVPGKEHRQEHGSYSGVDSDLAQVYQSCSLVWCGNAQGVKKYCVYF